MTAILVLAGGASRRMRGRDKLLEQVEGQPLLRRQVAAALATGAPVVVALPPGAIERQAALDGLAAQIVEVPEAALGMGHTLAGGVAAAPEGAVLVSLADMPEIGTDALALMLAGHEAAPDAVLRGETRDGKPGHPVLFPARLRPALLALTGDEGAHRVLKGEQVQPVPLPGRAALIDLDTPEDWSNWRAGTKF